MNDQDKTGTSLTIEVARRSYSFEIRTSALGRNYLRITENRTQTGKPTLRQRIIVFDEHIEAFVSGLSDVLVPTGNKGPQVLTRIAEIRRDYPKAYEKWTVEDDANLREAFSNCRDVATLADTFQRHPGAIASRLRKLGL